MKELNTLEEILAASVELVRVMERTVETVINSTGPSHKEASFLLEEQARVREAAEDLKQYGEFIEDEMRFCFARYQALNKIALSQAAFYQSLLSNEN